MPTDQIYELVMRNVKCGFCFDLIDFGLISTLSLRIKQPLRINLEKLLKRYENLFIVIYFVDYIEFLKYQVRK